MNIIEHFRTAVSLSKECRQSGFKEEQIDMIVDKALAVAADKVGNLTEESKGETKRKLDAGGYQAKVGFLVSCGFVRSIDDVASHIQGC